MSTVLLRWTAHPAKSRPQDVALVVAVCCLTAGAVLYSLESPLLTLLAVVILLIAIAPFLLPTRYTVTDEGIEQVRAFSRRARRFSELRRVEIGPRAALVSPFARPSWLDRYRGMTVFLDGADRAALTRILQDHVHA